MTTQHTPGPWRPFTRYVMANGRFLAKAFEANDATEHPGFIPAQEPQQTQAEAAANARLIASAPELLAALERLYQMGEWQRTITDEMGATVGHAYSAARAAIAKATGAPLEPSTFNLQPSPA